MRNRLILFLLASALSLPVAASAATITASAPFVGLGTTTVDLVLDPQGVSTGAWLVVLGGTGVSIDSITGVVPGGTDCFGLTSAASFDGQCASMPLNGSAVVASVTITGSLIGGTLSLVSGNITDFNTFLDTGFAPTILVTVPEPGSLALAGLGALALAARGRLRWRSAE